MTYRYYPPTVDCLDIEPSSDGLGVRIGIFNTTDSGTYTCIEVMNRDLEEVITALRDAAGPRIVSAPSEEDTERFTKSLRLRR